MTKFDEKYLFDLRQETIYFNSDFLNKRWYRELFGGQWVYIKLGKDTPNIGMFATWTKIPDRFSGYIKTIRKEKYPETNVDTKWKLIKQLIKNIIKDFTVKL